MRPEQILSMILVQLSEIAANANKGTAVADAVMAGKGASSEAPVVDEFVEVVEAEAAETEAAPEETGDAE